ncbi:MAG: hypothetical protein Q8R96_11125 [Bacteroidota bacterium]|nr:hypothetical protein [Bacteroidota bacterium]
MNLDDIQIYLPKYLSSESSKELFEGLKDFPDNLDSRLYTTYLKDEIIYQGDGLRKMLAVNLPDVNLKSVDGMVLSNTCDIEQSNKRPFPSQIVYSPIINLERYQAGLVSTIGSEERIDNHILEIRKQKITQIFFLPSFGDVLDESIIFLDRVFNIANDYIDRPTMSKTRIFSLSDYGNYLFLLKLSIHFTRIQDRVDRKSVRI